MANLLYFLAYATMDLVGSNNRGFAEIMASKPSGGIRDSPLDFREPAGGGRDGPQDNDYKTRGFVSFVIIILWEVIYVHFYN